MSGQLVEFEKSCWICSGWDRSSFLSPAKVIHQPEKREPEQGVVKGPKGTNLLFRSFQKKDPGANEGNAIFHRLRVEVTRSRRWKKANKEEAEKHLNLLPNHT